MFRHLKDAKKDESVRKSYKYLAALHEVRHVAFWSPRSSQNTGHMPPLLLPQNCHQLIQTIEDTGTILREIRDLEEQVACG